ncbi:MAG: DUF6597 domain-containing transcriptional factor [bacterium]
MQHQIKKYPVQNPILRNYIKFFWEIDAENMNIHHQLIPVRNVDLKFNLSETPHYAVTNSSYNLLDTVYFRGLQDKFTKTQLTLNGKVHVLGICFLPFGMYPFLKFPISEVRNQLLGANEVGFKEASIIREKLMSATGVSERLKILEKELSAILDSKITIPKNFDVIFGSLKEISNINQLTNFCNHHNINIRKLERYFNKYVGISPKSYASLSRFQNGLNQIIHNDYNKLSDIAYNFGYFDQMHFIKEFKRFSGNTPKKFASRNDSMLHVGKFY